MADYTVIQAVGKTLSDLLWSSFEADPVINDGIVRVREEISFRSPYEVKEEPPNSEKLSLYLYRITEDGFKKNERFQPLNNRSKYPPLALDLFYLITPFTGSSDNDHLLLGKVMQVFYDNSIVAGDDLQGTLRADAQELRLVLNPISLEDMTKLWSACTMAYRLAISYEARVVYLDSERPQVEAPRVTRRESSYAAQR